MAYWADSIVRLLMFSVFLHGGPETWLPDPYLKASNTDPVDLFGRSIAASGSTVIVGALFEDSGASGIDGDSDDNSAISAGAAYVFVRRGEHWRQEAYLKASNADGALIGDRFGAAVAICGDTAVVGAPYESSSAAGVDGDQSDNSLPASGAAYVFVRSGGTWRQEAYLKASHPDEQDQFGWSVAVAGDIVVVGARFESGSATGVNGDPDDNGRPSSGAAYVFVRDGTTWCQQAYLKASNTRRFAYFGFSVAASGETVVVGSPIESSAATGVNGDQDDTSAEQAGAAYVFLRSASEWTQQAYLKASNTGRFDRFGQSVSISAETLVVGAEGEDSSATVVDGDGDDDQARNSGAAYVFVRHGATWNQQAYLKASNGQKEDHFGFSTAVVGDLVLVGAHREDGGGAAVNRDHDDNSSEGAGAVYAFLRQGDTWQERAYLKAPNPDEGDEFGYSLAATEDMIAIGAYAEDGGAIGVNGDPHDDTATDSGAAYVFTSRPPGAARGTDRIRFPVRFHPTSR